MLDFSSFSKALKSLEQALKQLEIEPENSFLHDACIQRFEYSYELSHKMLKRFLEQQSATPSEIDDMRFQDLIRTGYERRLLSEEWIQWKIYRRARGTTSHTYDENKAKEVLNIVPRFYQEARFLLGKLEAANG
jgi:nucleotidyltransferase substrate binding protein (TIGR01987 family)